MQRRSAAWLTFLFLYLTVSAMADENWLCGREAWGEAHPFSIFLEKDIHHTQTDCEGRVAAGRNATFQHYALGLAVVPDPGQKYALVVGNVLRFDSGSIWGGDIWCGERCLLSRYSHFSNVVSEGNRRVVKKPVDFATSFNRLKGLSIHLASLPASGEVVWGESTVVLAAKAGTPEGAWVQFNIEASKLSQTNLVTFDVPAKTQVLVNVAGSAAKLSHVGFTLGQVDPSVVVWNFSEATTLDLSHLRLSGVVLAPWADVRFENGLLEGKLIAQSMIGNGQVNQQIIRGCLPRP